MVSLRELGDRMRLDFRFSRQELQGLILAVLFTGFIFSFRNWGGTTFNVISGLKNLSFTIIAAAIVFLFHIAFQKIYALSIGHKIEFRAWMAGLLIGVVLAFMSAGYLTLVLAGGISLSFIVRQRVGEFRYGHNIEEQGITSFYGVYGCMVAAMIFRIFTYYFPKVLFFEKGILISLIFAICLVLPLPRMAGLSIFFGSRILYATTVLMVIVGSLLLLLGGGIGLVLAIVLTLIINGYILLFVASEI